MSPMHMGVISGVPGTIPVLRPHGVAPSESSEHPDARKSSPPTFDNFFGVFQFSPQILHFVGAMFSMIVSPLRALKTMPKAAKKEPCEKIGKDKAEPTSALCRASVGLVGP